MGRGRGEFKAALHPRAKDGKFTSKPGGSAVVRMSPERKAKVAALVQEGNRRYATSGAPEWEKAVAQDAGVGKRRNTAPSSAYAHETELRRAMAARPHLPGAETYDLNAQAARVMGRRDAAAAATELERFSGIQQGLRAAGSGQNPRGRGKRG